MGYLFVFFLLSTLAISLVSNQTCIDELICYFADSLRQHLQELSAGTWNSQARIALFLRQTLVNFQKMSFKAVANLCSQIQEVKTKYTYIYIYIKY